jgi:Zn-dependent metalloprotease
MPLTFCPCCSIVPNEVLRRLAADPTLPEPLRQEFADAARVDTEVRKLRAQATRLTRVESSIAPAGLKLAVAPAPAVKLYDCNHGKTLPGAPVANPGASADGSVKRTYDETAAVAEFFRQAFGRNSIDDGGMTLLSSVHYGDKYPNAQWNGVQMIYGDGDGEYFIDFTLANDVIAHELTHGVTQHTVQLAYANEPGGLNESMSDVFGSMFRQWRAQQTADAADWLIGKEIMGPKATAQGITCLRDMSKPDGKHCLARQPTHYRDYKPGMDPHDSSGIPNLAFHKVAVAIGGHSWEKAGKIWYRAMTAFSPSPYLKMKAFADRTRKSAAVLFPGDAAVAAAVDGGWKQVGL